MGASYKMTIPEVPVNIGALINLNIPVTGSVQTITVNSILVSGEILGGNFDQEVYNGIKIHVHVNPGSIEIDADQFDLIRVTLPPIVINAIPLNVTVGPTPLSIPVAGTIGPISVPIIDIPAGPGIGNSTTNPSSGFFNTGVGGGSGFGNSGGLVSGWASIGKDISGFFRNIWP
ncbi:hypothetical protein [Mycobacterium riyadhense]|uniref:hypothetical protein n=1 Tax=Mycobacterium riyadhense TaxID=486698 RepID=UPI001EF9E55D|nr:hypothetical protein [Mycobacterium riyadhense]